MNLVTCNGCNKVYFEVSLEYIRSWEADWANLCKSKSQEWLSSYGIKDRKPPSAKDQFCRCLRCGGSYLNFRDSKPNECRAGVTISNILNRTEKLD